MNEITPFRVAAPNTFDFLARCYNNRAFTFRAETVKQDGTDNSGIGGAFSTFQFMANVPSEAAVSNASPASGEEKEANSEMSAFSFLSVPALSAEEDNREDERKRQPKEFHFRHTFFLVVAAGGRGWRGRSF